MLLSTNAGGARMQGLLPCIGIMPRTSSTVRARPGGQFSGLRALRVPRSGSVVPGAQRFMGAPGAEQLGFGRIVASEIGVPTLLVNLVESG